jgi:hypothetical protein
MLDSAIAKKLRNGTGGVIRKANHRGDLSAYCAKVDTGFASRIGTSYELAAFSGPGAVRLRRMPARLRRMPVALHYCWTTGGAAVDCAAPCRAGAALRAGFFGAAGLAAGAAASTGVPAGGGWVSSAGSTVSF